MAVLRSYVSGGWYRTGRRHRRCTTRSPATRSARVSSDGVDMRAALELRPARRRPGAARADLPPARGAAQGGRRRCCASTATSSTSCPRAPARRSYDAKFDVDGGIGVLLAYASKAKRELPNDTFYVEGAVEPLGRGGQFVGQHILTPLPGVAVQINAFNFPVWGPLEKFAPRSFAGVPSLVKPASQTAYLTARLVELIVESGLLPEGALQFVCRQRRRPARSPRPSRTCCRSPARRPPPQRLRTHPNVVARVGALQRRGRLAELLDPRPGRRAGHAGVRPVRQAARHRDDRQGRAEVHRDPPRVRAGGRRSTPWSRRSAARLAKVVVGAPAAEGGADGRARQPGAARGGAPLAQGAARRPGRLVFGDPEHVEVVGADAERGAFVSPMLLRCADADARRAARGRGVRAGEHADALPRRRRRDRARGARPGQPGRVGRHRRRRLRRARRARRRAVARPAAGARPGRRGGVDRARLAAAGARARRPGTRRRRRGDGRHARRAAPHAAHRRAGQPADARRGHRPLGRRRARARRRACTRSASRWPSCGSATRWWPARAR